MAFIITLIALVMERFFHWQHLRQWRWFHNYEASLNRVIGQWPAPLRLFLNILPPLLLVGCISFLISGLFYGLLELIFGVVVLLYCLGPENLWVEIYKYIQAANQNDPTMMDHISKTFHISPDREMSFHEALTRAIFIKANDRIFAVIFWFVVLGPLGAMLYRLITIFSEHQEWGLSDLSLKIKQILDWLPVRLFALFFALGGHFTEVFSVLRKYFRQGLDGNELLLTECGMRALDYKNFQEGIMEKEAMQLLDRAFVLGLVVLAIGVLIL
ncbi:MAG TPA: regulatory signaling modulator protein AmpE [Gammaproteobacteria bacterium]|nr:regulatory signaling modulator protein AmpE [Gammaproteobacteria bacterium]